MKLGIYYHIENLSVVEVTNYHPGWVFGVSAWKYCPDYNANQYVHFNTKFFKKYFKYLGKV